MTVTPTSIKSYGEEGTVMSRGHSDKTKKYELEEPAFGDNLPSDF